MMIRCWGCRGSLPVSGPEYLRYGGDTTCLELRTAEGELVVVDAGSGIRALGNSALKEGLKRFHIIFSHAHLDHVMGFPFFKPAYRPQTELIFYGCPFAHKSIKSMIDLTMSPPTFPVRFEEMAAKKEFRGDCLAPFAIGSLRVQPILLSHPNQGIGYKFTEGGSSFVFLTDNEFGFPHPGGLQFEAYRDFCAGADLLVHDAEFTPEEYRLTRSWGHTPYPEAVRLALAAGVKRLGLTHHNQDRSDDGMDALLADARRIIQEAGSGMECFALRTGWEIRL
ncbi:MAG: metal-dependent hydrolase [Elusimicrobia bacterium GWA2_69_24]|nr:MAG: metal-dependent hydrolase [Elusimicrobia bacterium GWA2_69_24]HBL16613.1 MBL fold metallo-hydrolase [Elusimicrobiota bacterium]